MVEDIVPKTWYICHNNDDHIIENPNKKERNQNHDDHKKDDHDKHNIFYCKCYFRHALRR